MLLKNPRIMMVGDSITVGYLTDNYNVRTFLSRLTSDFGVCLDFVGPYSDPLISTTGDATKHAAVIGITAQEVNNQWIALWMAANTPDIVLIHLGTNDLRLTSSAQDTVKSLGEIVDKIYTANPNVIILLAQIIGTSTYFDNKVNELNTLIPVLVQDKKSTGVAIYCVNQNESVLPLTDMLDGVHPAGHGYMKMAQRWFEGLVANKVITATKELKNISKCKGISISPLPDNGQELNSYDASLAFDDSVANGFFYRATSLPQYIEIDLHRNYNVYMIDLYHASRYVDESSPYNLYSYKIEFSQDKKSWTEVDKVLKNTKGRTSHGFNATTTRYVRLSVLENAQGIVPEFRLNEMRVYGTPVA